MKYLHMLPLAFLFAYTGRVLVVGAGLSDAVIISAFCAVYVVQEHFNQNKKIKEFEEKMLAYEKRFEGLQLNINSCQEQLVSIKLNHLSKTMTLR